MKDSQELRAFLVDQMQKVSEGKVGTERAKGVANLAQQVYNTINLEVKMALVRSKMKEGQEIKPVSFE